jgi:hypothetical protein
MIFLFIFILSFLKVKNGPSFLQKDFQNSTRYRKMFRPTDDYILSYGYYKDGIIWKDYNLKVYPIYDVPIITNTDFFDICNCKNNFIKKRYFKFYNY